VGNRRNPTARNCPRCGGPGEKIETLWQVGRGPNQSIIYLLHFHWPHGRVDPWHIRLGDGSIVKFQADHYLGKTRNLPQRLEAHQDGRAANLTAVALTLGAELLLTRTWRVPLPFEARLKDRGDSPSPQSRTGQRRGGSRSFRPYCPLPECGGEKAWGNYRETKVKANYRAQRQAIEAKRQARREWDAHRVQLQADGVWDADRAWDEAFPHLAYDTPVDQATHPAGAAADQATGAPTACRTSQHTWLDPADATKCCNPLWTKNLVVYSLDDRPQPGDCPVRDLPGMAWRWVLSAHVEARPPELDLTADIPID